MIRKFAGRLTKQDDKEKSPLLPDDPKHKEEWLAAARKSECATNMGALLQEHGRAPREVGLFQEETFGRVYEALGAEVEGEDLARVLVVRNEKFGKKTTIFLTLITLGLFCCFRPRDDDTVLVLTKQGRIVQLRIERAALCPPGALAQFFVFAKYMAILFTIFVLPVLIQCAVNGTSIVHELHNMHLDRKGLEDFPAYASEHRITIALTGAVLLFWVCALMPHDYRDRHRRRHMAREVAGGQLVVWGWSCRRRSSMKLFFGKYPNQAALDLAGNLGNAPCCGPVSPSSLLSNARPSAPGLIVGLTVFLSLVGGLNTAVTWGERSMVLQHMAVMQLFCKETRDEGVCQQAGCEGWGRRKHRSVSVEFCKQVAWEPGNDLNCLRFGHQAPCCTGCEKGAYEDYTSEGTMATFKSVLSLLADAGTLLFTFMAAKYALGLAVESDHIDVLIKRRSKNARQMEIAKFDNTLPVCLDFMEYVFGKARNSTSDQAAEREPLAPAQGEDRSKWCGVLNYEVDSNTKTWDDFFDRELLVSPDCRWTSQVKVPRKCLGIADDETVLAAWAELPLYPLNMTLADFFTGGLLYQILPFGKTRHAVIVTNRRLFYVRYRRPDIPLKVLGVALRVDCFRHDKDVFYGQMARAKPLFMHKMMHQTLLRERFMPGTAALRTKFGTLRISRSHGDVLDVYQLICQLSRNTAQFVTRQMLEQNHINWDRCQQNLETSLTKKSDTLWTIQPQPDDVVEPKPDVQLSHAGEQLVFHMSFKDVGWVTSPCYTNTDLVVSTGRVFLWHRSVFKKFDCQALVYWCCFWGGFMNRIFGGMNLPNSCSFFTLPALLSFSTDMSVDPPSWLQPHHQPLKCPFWETLCSYLTNCCCSGKGESDQAGKGLMRYSCVPKRTGPSANVKLLWRLRQSAQADEDFIIVHSLRPYAIEEAPESDADDVYAGLGFTPAQVEESKGHSANRDHDEAVEALRKIMSVAQDQCHQLLDQIDTLY